ncbi:MAG: hypothetical protein K0S88_570 [Actinomycetia bacterium]|nr:hypothetical protein [Actinomycetes bacterium]
MGVAGDAEGVLELDHAVAVEVQVRPLAATSASNQAIMLDTEVSPPPRGACLPGIA